MKAHTVYLTKKARITAGPFSLARRERLILVGDTNSL
jgi:hypothetical protein